MFNTEGFARTNGERSLLGVRWVAVHWLALVNLGTVFVLLGAVVAPALAALGRDTEAQAIHRAYLVLCPQRPEHSFFLFGNQLALEEREIAMFVAQLGAGVWYASRRSTQSDVRLGWKSLLVFSIPMTWDILSQQLGLRDSDWFARTWTGLVFSAAFVLWFYPYLDVAWRSPSADRKVAELR